MLSRVFRPAFLAVIATACGVAPSFDDFDLSAPPPEQLPPPAREFTVSGEVKGLESARDTVTLSLNGGDPIVQRGSGRFKFEKPLLPDGATFSVSVTKDADGYTCKGAPRTSDDPNSGLTSEGRIEGADRTDVVISCIPIEGRLDSLEVAEGALEPPFDPNVAPPKSEYKVAPLKLPLPLSATPPVVHVTAKVSHASAKLTIAGKEATSGVAVPIDIKAGDNKIEVTVTSRYGNGASSTRVINVAGYVNDFLVDTPSYKRSSIFPIGQSFGYRMAMVGNTLAIGAPDESTTVANGGAVFVYSQEGASPMRPSWKLAASIKRATPIDNELFGQSVALSADGNTLVIGAPGEDFNTGAVYIYNRATSGGAWTFTQRIRASNAREDAGFGESLAISGNTIVVGSPYESSRSPGINGNQTNQLMPGAGAAYVFVRNPTTGQWSQQAYVKASNPQQDSAFALNLALLDNTLVVGMMGDSSDARGINGNQTNRTALGSGAAYIFERAGTTWTQKAYVKASNSGVSTCFGSAVGLTSKTVVIGAFGESSNAKGINGNQADTSAEGAGAVYTFVRDGAAPSGWKQDTYIKASNTSAGNWFGMSLGVSELPNGVEMLAIGSPIEPSAATGINGDELDKSINSAGAVYVYTRQPAPSSTWEKKAYVKTHPPTAELLDFGNVVHVSGSNVLVSTDSRPGVWIF